MVLFQRWVPFLALWLGLVGCAHGPVAAGESAQAGTQVAAQKPYPTAPAEAVALKEAGTHWTNCEIRLYYNELINGIPSVDAQMQQAGKSAEERARAAYDIRHNARITARAMMEDAAEVQLLRERDQQKYGNPDGPTFEQLVEKSRAGNLEGDAVYTSIIESSQRTDEKVNEECGIKPR